MVGAWRRGIQTLQPQVLQQHHLYQSGSSYLPLILHNQCKMAFIKFAYNDADLKKEKTKRFSFPGFIKHTKICLQPASIHALKVVVVMGPIGQV